MIEFDVMRIYDQLIDTYYFNGGILLGYGSPGGNGSGDGLDFFDREDFGMSYAYGDGCDD